MSNKKLEIWAEQLLDTGKRNNLINFKDTKLSSSEVLIPEIDALFEMADSGAKFEVFDPAAFENEPIESEETEKYSEKNKDDFIKKYSEKIKKQKQLLLFNQYTSSDAVLRNIDKKAREHIEETGSNVAYMAFGFIEWKESDRSDIILKAPILLVPIRFERESAAAPYYIETNGDEITVNPTFSYKLNTEYGIRLPEYEDEGLKEYLEKVVDIVKSLKWTVSYECKIGIFSFQKINMYRDLIDNEQLILENTNIKRILGERVHEQNFEKNTVVHTKNPLIDLHNVVDADSSQIEAIETVRSGKSFVLQGPPGTGKSQTITNIIAECLGEGKKVLFVSKKLAALNVVYDKLKKTDLSEFCLELHSHKSNKKDVINELCRTLRSGKSTLSSKAEEETAALEKAQKQLDLYAEELHKPRENIGKSLYKLFEEYSALRNAPDIEWEIPDIEQKDEKYLTDAFGMLEQYQAFVPFVGTDYKKNPWYGYQYKDNSFTAKAQVKNNLRTGYEFLTAVIPVINDISQNYGVDCTNAQKARVWHRFFDTVKLSDVITPSLFSKPNFDKAAEILPQMKALSEDIKAEEKEIETEFDKEIYDKIDASECYKQLTRQFSGAFSRLFGKDYKKIISDMQRYRKNGDKPKYAEAVAFAEKLSARQEKKVEFGRFDLAAKNLLGTAYIGIDTDWEKTEQQLKMLKDMYALGFSFGNMERISKADFDTEKWNFSIFADRLLSCKKLSVNENGDYYKTAEYFDSGIYDITAETAEKTAEKYKACLDNFDKIDNWIQFKNLLSRLDEQGMLSYIDFAIRTNINARHIADSFKKQFYFQKIDNILCSDPVLSSFNRISQDKTVETFSEKDTQHFEINKAKIKTSLSAERPSLDMIAPGSSVAVLLREGEKKRKQKSIRTLLSEEAELIQLLKPCFLMSPLSVSTFLTSDKIHFDTVIFDEASQIFPQDAVGSIYRADQLIVVGDSKQMPPSDFFRAGTDAAEYDDNNENEDITDFESILDLCSSVFSQFRLKWHYRSRYEQLIAFSNKNFYDNDLVTFPSSKADAKWSGVDYYHVGGIFDRKSHTNRKEAEFTVELIYKNIELYPERSLGVVAFSAAQQDLIDRLLLKRRRDTPEKEFFFRTDAKEPFFVKNLETVQGDERDTIIFSTAYGKDEQGRLLHNFGPLNRVGGERRLNVAVTRAKENVQLVSSMHYTDIDLKRTSAEGARLLREYLDFAENGDVALLRSIKLNINPIQQFDSNFEAEVYDFLRNNGFSADMQVGCSGFRIDIGLKRPDSSDYVLAIECDGASYHSSKNARDRDRLRQEILERMGWRFYRIWSTDWFKNKATEQQKLLETAKKAINSPAPIKPKQEENFSEPPKETGKKEDSENFTEEAQNEEKFEFPKYRTADAEQLIDEYAPDNYLKMVKKILETEAPMSEELLMKRTAGFFDRDKVTSVVRNAFEKEMSSCENAGIIRKNGFLYLKNSKEIIFRTSSPAEREVNQICPKELAQGMLEIIKRSISIEKDGLYKLMAGYCGQSRVGKNTEECFNRALELLNGKIVIEGEKITLKNH